jgi:hypothetical protein
MRGLAASSEGPATRICDTAWSAARRRSAVRRSAIAAESTSPVPATTAMNTCSSTRLSCTLPPTKGPCPRTVPHTAIPATVMIAAAVSRCRKRRATQMTSGNTTYASWCPPRTAESRPAKTTSATTASSA